MALLFGRAIFLNTKITQMKNNHDLLPAALKASRLYDGKIYTRKELLDLLILEKGYVNKEIIKRKRSTVYKLSSPFGEKITFPAKAEKEYIDRLLSQVNKGASIEMEHKGTIEKIKKPNIKIKDAAKMIAADHIAEKVDYYDELSEAKLEKGGSVQDLSQGTTLEGPSHAKGGIEIQVNNKPVAEAEINQKGGGKELDCDKPCDTCEHKMENGDIIPTPNNNNEYEFFYNEIKTLFGDKLSSFSESTARQQDYPGQRVFVVKPNTQFSVEKANETIQLFQLRIVENGYGDSGITETSDIQFIYVSEENIFLILFNKKANLDIYLQKGGKLKKEKPVISTENLSDYHTNKAIEKMIDAKGIDPNNYTGDEKQYLRKYSGYGGIVADEFSLEEAKASFTEFYTPDTIVRKMWALAYKYGFKDGQNVLEPSVGTGEFLKYMPSNSMATGYEINKYSYSICKILYPQYNFYLQPFENVFIKNRSTLKNKISDLPTYDLAIGNPPYGDVSGIGMGMGEKQYTNAKNWIEYFILRGLDVLKPGGLLIYIIGTEVANGGTPFLQQGKSNIKTMIAERADLLDAYRLPNGVFDRTDVLSDILVFKKK